jgi:hypothetical protein
MLQKAIGHSSINASLIQLTRISTNLITGEGYDFVLGLLLILLQTKKNTKQQLNFWYR